MRQGRLLAQGEPRGLMDTFGVKDLEGVFFRLCYQDSVENNLDQKLVKNNEIQNRIISLTEENHNDKSDEMESLIDKKCNDVSLKVTPIQSQDTFGALLYKNITVLKRHISFMVFQTFLPLVSFLVFLAAIGQPMRDLNIAVVNHDAQDCGSRANLSCVDFDLVLNGEVSLKYSCG